MAKAADTLVELEASITERHPTLSRRLRQVAEYLVEHPAEVAFGTVAKVARDAGVHPSTLIRFANAFGFNGFSEMQRLFQNKLKLDAPSYQERIRLAREALGEEEAATAFQLLHQFVSAHTSSLEHLLTGISAADLERAVDILAAANATHIVGVRRAFVIASYFSYAMRHIDRRAYLIDGVGGMYPEQSTALSREDALIAISFHPYAKETQDVARQAVAKGLPLIVITDCQFSPLASEAEVCFVVKEADVHSFRSLSSSLCLALTISISLAYRLENHSRSVVG